MYIYVVYFKYIFHFYHCLSASGRPVASYITSYVLPNTLMYITCIHFTECRMAITELGIHMVMRQTILDMSLKFTILFNKYKGFEPRYNVPGAPVSSIKGVIPPPTVLNTTFQHLLKAHTLGCFPKPYLRTFKPFLINHCKVILLEFRKFRLV